MPPLTPDQLFGNIVYGAHNDAVILTAALLLFWTIKEKQASDIGGRTARSLLRREGGHEDHYGSDGQDLGFRSLFLDLIRLEIAGGRFREDSYAAELDQLVEVLDNMTELRVVPGRVFTPSTLHGRDDLLLSFVAMLTAAAPDNGDDGLGNRITALAREEGVLPEGDGSLRNILRELGRFGSALEPQQQPQFVRGVALLAPNRDAEQTAGRVREIIGAAEAAIEAERLRRLEALPVDPSKLARIRSAIETALLNDRDETPFFDDVQVGPAAHNADAQWRDMLFKGISKAQLTDPPMEPPMLGLEEQFVSGARDMAGNYAWRAFCQHRRTIIQVSARAEEEIFWQEIAPLVDQVGPDPVLVVSRIAEGRAWQRFMYAASSDRPNLKIERRPRSEKGGSYIATVEGVDVFGADFTPGEAWLFSAKSLRSVRYAELNQPRHYVDTIFDLGEGMKGTLRVRVRQRLEWANTPIYELRAPDPDETDNA
jgi:hypothetical protein